MKILGSWSGLLSGRGRAARPISLAEGEVELAREVATLRPGGLTSVGGDVVLTNARLIFTPLEVGDVTSLLSWGMGKAGAPTAVSSVIDRVERLVAAESLGSLSGLREVRAGDGASLWRPPTLVVETTDGEFLEIGILASRGSPSISGANEIARDRMVAEVAAHLLPRR